MEEWHVKDESDRARTLRKIGDIHLIGMGDFGGGRSGSRALGRGLDVL